MLTSSTQLQNRSFHVVERTRTSLKCPKMKNARAKRAKVLFFIVKYANLKDNHEGLSIMVLVRQDFYRVSTIYVVYQRDYHSIRNATLIQYSRGLHACKPGFLLDCVSRVNSITTCFILVIYSSSFFISIA